MMKATDLLRKYTLTSDEQQAIEQAITDLSDKQKTTRANAALQLHNLAWSGI